MTHTADTMFQASAHIATRRSWGWTAWPAEQVFHVAERWESILGWTAPVHFQIFLLLFAQYWNDHHDCAPAFARWSTAQRSSEASCSPRPCTPPNVAASAENFASDPCVLPVVKRSRTNQVIAPAVCPPAPPCSSASAAASSSASGTGAVGCASVPVSTLGGTSADDTLAGIGRQFVPLEDDELVLFNPGSSTVHRVSSPIPPVATRCGWRPSSAHRSLCVRDLREEAGVGNLQVCGTCCGERVCFPAALSRKSTHVGATADPDGRPQG